jgi:hypothetical protein
MCAGHLSTLICKSLRYADYFRSCKKLFFLRSNRWDWQPGSLFSEYLDNMNYLLKAEKERYTINEVRYMRSRAKSQIYGTRILYLIKSCRV